MASGGIKDWFGKCLVGGRHTPGTEAWRECPERNAQKRSDRAKKAARTRWGKQEGPNKHPGDTQTPPDASGAA